MRRTCKHVNIPPKFLLRGKGSDKDSLEEFSVMVVIK